MLNFTNDYRFITLADNQEYIFEQNKTYKLKATKDICDEDWKTAIAHGNPIIPRGTVVELDKIISNLYGLYFVIRYNGYLFYTYPHDFEYIDFEI